jgi:hypothetical protein
MPVDLVENLSQAGAYCGEAANAAGGGYFLTSTCKVSIAQFGFSDAIWPASLSIRPCRRQGQALAV